MGLPFLVTRRRQGIHRYLIMLERLQSGLDLLITGLDPRLVAVVELKRLTQSKHVFAAVVTGERCSYRLLGIPVRRDDLVSVVYSTELNSTTSLVPPQRTDRYGILDEKPPTFQLLSG